MGTGQAHHDQGSRQIHRSNGQSYSYSSSSPFSLSTTIATKSLCRLDGVLLYSTDAPPND